VPQVEEVLPKYLQIANSVRDQVLSGALAPGAELPSERELAAEWRVARPTAARALVELRRLGLVETRRGAKSVVRGTAVAYGANDRYSTSKDTGKVYGPNQHAKIVSAELMPPPGHVADALSLAEKDTVIRRHRVIIDGDEAIESSVSWFAGTLAETAPRLLQTDRIREGTTAYVEQVTGRTAVTARDRVCARRATAEESQALGLVRGSAVLVTEHLVLDRNGDALEFAESVNPPGSWTQTRDYLLRP
jgi:DNA-binding GntR family transcriptional regulator